MSVTPEQSAEALNGMFKFGQSLAAGFFDYLGKQNAAFQQAAPAQAPQLPLPEASDMARLQQELAEVLRQPREERLARRHHRYRNLGLP